jgi:hypothetical protein
MIEGLFSHAPDVTGFHKSVYSIDSNSNRTSLKGDNFMAQKVNIQYVDDLDGTEAVECVQFSLDGKAYEIDLSETNAAELRESLAKFIKAARRTSSTSTAARSAKKVGSAGAKRDETQAIRLWAIDQNMEISERGRIPETVMSAYKMAHAS